MVDESDPLSSFWAAGYSIADLWGHGLPVSRNTSLGGGPHLLLWGILSIVEQQVSQGAGHRYLRERLRSGDWVALGFLAPKDSNQRLSRVPPIRDAKFGRKDSAIGDGMVKYVEVRIVNSQFYVTK